MSQKTYRIVLWSSVIGALALVVLVMAWVASGAGQKPAYVPGLTEILSDDHVTGKADSKVTVLEFADFQCPACGEFYPVVKKLVANYGNRVRFVYRNFPIPGHVNGRPAAYAAEAAALQGKFFEMEDKLFTNQKNWSTVYGSELDKAFDSYAQEIGLDIKKFDSDRAADAVKAKVDKDAQSGINSGVDSTPSFFLNGTRVQLKSYSYDEFAGQIDAALKANP